MSDHLIDLLDVRVSLPDVTMALALRPRIEALCWQLMPRVLEQVFDELAPVDTHVRIAAIDLDLGRLRPDHIEEDALTALRETLSDALSGAILRARQGNSEADRLLTRSAARLGQFEAYLVSGVVPFAHKEEPLDALARLRELASDSPATLAAMLRRRAQSRHVLERLVLQLGAEGLAMMLSVLAPADAAIILALLADVILVQRRIPLPALRALSEPALTRLIWVTALEFLLRDAGTQFNRRRFLGALILREANRLGISYDALLELLEAAVAIASERSSLRSSLPGTLAELLAERRSPALSNGTGQADAAHIAIRTEYESRLSDRSVIAADPLIFERLTANLTPGAFTNLLNALEPVAAKTILADLNILIQLHGRAAFLPIRKGDFVRRLHALVLAYIAGRTAGRFDHTALWRFVLKGLAIGDGDGAGAADLAPAIEQRLRRSGSMAAYRLSKAIFAARAGAADSAAASIAITDIPASGHPEDEPIERIMILLRAGAQPADLAPVMRAVPAAAFSALVRKLFPAGATALLADMDALTALHATTPLLDMSHQTFETWVRFAILAQFVHPSRGSGRRAILKAVIAMLADKAGRRSAAFAAMLRHRLGRPGKTDRLFAGIDDGGDSPAGAAAAAGERIGSITLADPERASQASPMERAHIADEDRRLIEHFLQTGQPRLQGRYLPDFVRDVPEWLAITIRRLVRDRPDILAAVVERLMEWLLPDEIVTMLAPHHSAGILRTSNRMTGADQAYWTPLLAAVIREEQGEKVARPSAARLPHPGVHLDRVAVIAAWLDRSLSGAGGESPVIADLLELNVAEWTGILLHEDKEQTLRRLIVLATTLGDLHGPKLLERLAPWVANQNGPLAITRERRDPAARGIMLRAAAASLGGGPIDMASLLLPVPTIPIAPSIAARDVPVEAAFDAGQLFAWLDGAPATADEAAAYGRLFARLVDSDDPALAGFIAQRRTRRRARARWAVILPTAALGRLVHLLVPTEARALLDGFMLLMTAWRQVAPFGARRPAVETSWALLLDQIAEPRRISVPAVLDTLLTGLAGDDARHSGRIRERARKLARDGGYITVATALGRVSAPAPQPAVARAVPADSRPSAGDRNPDLPEEPKHPLYVGNAGLVLLHPYLPMFFDRLGLLVIGDDDRPHIPAGDPASRAVHLLQYLVDERLDRAEPELALNKLLCGLAIAEPVARSITPDAADLRLCDELLGAVIANWPILENTSLAGLRETFLQREGRLRHGYGKWTLQVQRKVLDVLTDQVPWSFAVVYHRWMTDPIHVTW